MKAGQASATARLIAAATVLCAHDPTAVDLVPRGAAGWCEEFLSTSRADRWLRASSRPAATRAAWRLLERATHAGIVRHWMLRKRWIESRVRAKITAATSQVVVLGAGFDTLGVRLASECPGLRVVEVDQPATLAVKRSVVQRKLGSDGPILADADLARDDATGSVLPAGLIDRSLSSIFIAEGLLMYLPEARVRSLLLELATATAPGSWLIFSFMVEREGGAIGFEPRSALVSWWLSMKGEPFRWSLNPARAELFARELGWSVTAHADSNVLAGLDTSALRNRAIVTGEEVIEATTTESWRTPTLRADSSNV
jgi:methyltransferase (TIGR00027 family)